MFRACAHWIAIPAATLAILLAGPAGAVQTNGFQTIVDFEEFAPGVGAITYPSLDTFISGGVVTNAVGLGVPAHSGDNVYVGTSITSQQTHGDFNFQGVDLWPYMGAFVTPGDAAVTASFYGYDPDLHGLVLLGSKETSGPGANQLLDWTWGGGQASLIDVTFSSASPFALDDLLLGDPNIGPGIPEPSAWLLALAGFGLLGATLRGARTRRRA